MENKLVDIFRSRSAGPFLFLGSGFSRRYLGLEDWRGLLSKFCVAGKPFEYYLSAANGNYPKVAALLAKDFNEYWWAAPEYAGNVDYGVSNYASSFRKLAALYDRLKWGW